MPPATDYSTTYVYEIVCKDVSVSKKYLGYTTNFTQRKYNHKRAYQQNPTQTEIYTTMTENGGFDNWHIRVIAKYNCKDADDARMMLQNHPGYILETIKQEVFVCQACEYQCDVKSNFKVHCKSAKHIAKIAADNMTILPVQATPPTSTSSLEHLVIELVKQNQGQQEQMAEIMKQNQQIQAQMIEICNRPTQVNNTTNNSFRLNVFLNETCKEAIDVNDFIDNMVITVDEIMRQATMSYEDGFAAILKDRLCDKLTIETRPIHFTDIKRETIIYKDKTKNAWVRDDGFSIQQNMCREMTKQIGNYVCANRHLLPNHIFDSVMKNSCPDSEKQRSKIMRMIMPYLCLPKEGTPVGNRTVMR
jgi:hypothetical protein